MKDQESFKPYLPAEKITATSAENYSLLLMEFTEDTDMNSALVKVDVYKRQAGSQAP